MKGLRLALWTGLSAAVQLLLAGRVLGLTPPLLPGLIYSLGAWHGAQYGAACGFLGGILLGLGGSGPEVLPLLTLLGGGSGEVFHNTYGKWGRLFAGLPALAVYEGILTLGHGLTGAGLAAVPLGAAEWLLAAVGLVPAWLILGGHRPRRKERRTWNRIGTGFGA